jgi:hypothetical protein
MFVESLSDARAVSVLLGGSGVSRPVARGERDVGALLSPRKPQTRHDVARSIYVARPIGTPVDRHD